MKFGLRYCNTGRYVDPARAIELMQAAEAAGFEFGVDGGTYGHPARLSVGLSRTHPMAACQAARATSCCPIR